MFGRAFVAALAAGSVVLATGAPMAQAQGPAASTYQPLSVEVFARAPSISSVTMSPDGEHLAALTSHDGELVTVSIWKTDAMDQPPYVVGSHPKVRFMSVSFIKNDRMLVTTRQLHDFGPFKFHLFKTSLMDMKGEQIEVLARAGATVAGSVEEEVLAARSSIVLLSDLPNEPDYIVAQTTNPRGAGAIYRINVRTGRHERIMWNNDRYGGYRVDGKGEPRARQFLNSDGFIVQQIRHPDTNAWEDHFKVGGADRSTMSLVGFTKDPNIVLIAANTGADKISIYEYDIRARKMLEPMFQHRAFDASGVVQDGDLNLLGFTFEGERESVYWADGKLAALERDLKKAMGVKTRSLDWTDPGGTGKLRLSLADGADIQLLRWTKDFSKILVRKSGPDLPPEFYLVDNGKVVLLGRSIQDLNTAALGQTRLIQYPARDGMMIPAYLTTPPEAQFGTGPHPAILLPHGGPWSRDSNDWDFSGWTQYFASRGYVVLQPQFRGSRGWGQKLWTAGDGQWGQKMQDDKDDGARWLVAQKLARGDRIAIHGYSYGGYAAMAAAVRGGDLYRCAIAGAGVAELGSFREDTQENRYLRDYQTPTIKGLEPLGVAERATMPVMLYHGDRDTTVPMVQSTMFAAKLEPARKPHKLVKLEDMGHSISTWEPRHWRTVLTEVEKFLQTDCGMGG